MKPKILFTSVCTPFPKILDYSCTDEMAYRLTREQDLFCLYEHTHYWGLHLLAQNISYDSILLENPSFDNLKTELKNNYEYVAISFKPWHIEQLDQMCCLIRKFSPQSKIIVGGYGAICVPQYFSDQELRKKIDHVCCNEGVSYLRNLLGESASHNLNCQLPKSGSTLPWLNPRPMGTIGVILSGIGCSFRCPFCVTSASTKGHYLEVMTPEQIYKTMCNYWETSPFMQSVTIYDENFLDHADKVKALGKLIQNDKKFGLKKLNYFAFGSICTLSNYDPEELLLNGLDTLWVGVESKFTALKKREGMATTEAFKMLHNMGIKTVGSWIIGDDEQSPDNIEEDKDFFISHDPTFQQLSILSVVPGLALWHSLKSKNRIPDDISWKNYHIYGRTIEFKNFSYQEILAHLKQMYRQIYHEKGPALMKVLETNLNGYEFCLKSKNKLLKNDKSLHFKQKIESYLPILKTTLNFAPSSAVKSRIESIKSKYQNIFGQISQEQEKISDLILKKAEAEYGKRQKNYIQYREEPFRRYTYSKAIRPLKSKPYQVEYLDGDPFIQ